MNKLMLLGVLFATCLASCDKEPPKPLTQEQIRDRIDSITRIRLIDVEEKAKTELEHRIKIEVKVKADSILQAMRAHPVRDTASK
jgi:hypothetical protein